LICQVLALAVWLATSALKDISVLAISIGLAANS
jgi:hypothetical protein